MKIVESKIKDISQNKFSTFSLGEEGALKYERNRIQLRDMFPLVEPEVIDTVLEAHAGDVDSAIDELINPFAI